MTGDPRMGEVEVTVSGPTGDKVAARTDVLVKAYGAVIGVAVISILVTVFFVDGRSGLVIDVDNFEWFAMLFVVALAIERLLQPLMSTYQEEKVVEAKKELAEAKVASTEVTVKQIALTELQSDRAVVAWAVASCLAIAVCWYFGLGIVENLSDGESGPFGDSGRWAHLAASVDFVLTGMIVGAGTKPLHDLIDRVEKSKNKADPLTGEG